MSAFKTWLNGLTSKTTPVDADEMYLRDSVGAASNKVTWANLKATLLTYFDTAYLKLTGGTLAGGTVTASSPVLTTTQTWNNAAVAFTGKVTNITNTASAAGALLEEWQIGGVGKISIAKTNNQTSAPAILFGTKSLNSGAVAIYRLSAGSGETGWFTSGDAHYWTQNSSSAKYAMDNTSFAVGLGKSLAFASHSDLIGVNTKDVYLERDAAATLAQRNGTNAQTSRTYGTYTDASNYRRVAVAMTTAGVASIAPEGAGTGASGNVLHISGLPTSNPGAGILWNDTGTVKVGT